MRNFRIDAYASKRLTCEYAGASDWVTAVGPDDHVAVLYSCVERNCAPLKTNGIIGWLKAKTCSSGSYTKVQWHYPHCGAKWKWGKNAPERWTIIYQGSDDQTPAHFTWGQYDED
eukprot:5480022-Amphidinium_carterae.1